MAGEHIFLGEMEANPKPGPYADVIQAARQAGTEYWGIWNILAFHPMASYHLCELSHDRFVLGNGGKLVSDEAFSRLVARMAHVGYSREQPTHSQTEHASHA